MSRIELSSDPTIRSHLAAVYDTLEQNLLRVEPNSVVEMKYVARQVGQGRQAVEAKYVVTFFFFNHLADFYLFISSRLSQMILDQVLHGVLDHGRGCLLVFDEPDADVSPSRFLITCYCYLIIVYRIYAAQEPMRSNESVKSSIRYM